jgi:hypothetical protein
MVVSLTKSELATFAVIKQKHYVVIRRNEAVGAWSMEIQAAGDTFHVETQRGARKTWRTLEGAIEFARETCPNMYELQVVVDGSLTLSANITAPIERLEDPLL